jgi:ferrochelatase
LLSIVTVLVDHINHECGVFATAWECVELEQERTPEKQDWGVLISNLGTPEKPQRRQVARFLRQFLSDSRVVDLPRWLWIPVLNLVIIPLRAYRSAAAYRKVWWPEGSPLLVLTLRLTKKLSSAMSDQYTVIAGMRYGKPSIAFALEGLRQAGASGLVVLPLFPQFSYTTSASVSDAVHSALKKMDWQPTVKEITDYHQNPVWVMAVADSIVQFREQSGEAELLLFSLHGIPKRYVTKGDPYEDQCRAGVEAIAKAAGLKEDEWKLTFQSRVGREPWLTPYTDITLKELAAQGLRRVQVICPGFAVDCLETLEEIAMQNLEFFVEAGGESLEYIPALNDSAAHVDVLRKLVEEACSSEA